MELQRDSFTCSQSHRFFKQQIGKIPNLLGYIPVGPADFTDSMGLTFLDEFERRINAIAIVFTCALDSFVSIFFHPFDELMSKGCWVWSENDTNVKIMFFSNLTRHSNGVSIRFSVIAQRGWGRSEVGTMNENEMRPPNVLEILSSIKEASVTVEVEMVVENRSFPRPLSINHANSSETGDT